MSETPDIESLAMAPGQILKRAREGKNLTVAAIATLMNLDLRTIEALESGDQSKLPAPIFVRGYLRGYARLVGVNESVVLDAYQVQAPVDPIPRSVGMSKVPVRPAFRAPALPWRGLLLVLIALVAVWFGIQWGPQLIARLSGDSAPESAIVGQTDLPLAEPAEQPQATEQTTPSGESTALPLGLPQGEAPAAQNPESPASEAPAVTTGQMELTLPAPSSVPASEPTPASEPEPALPSESDFGTQAADAPEAPAAQEITLPPPGEVRLEVHISADSWVEVRSADGSKLVLDLLRKGDTRSVTGKAPLAVLLGNAAGVELRVDGKPFDHSRYDRDNIARFEIGGKP